MVSIIRKPCRWRMLESEAPALMDFLNPEP
jgi:hypothetical protein